MIVSLIQYLHYIEAEFCWNIFVWCFLCLLYLQNNNQIFFQFWVGTFTKPNFFSTDHACTVLYAFSLFSSSFLVWFFFWFFLIFHVPLSSFFFWLSPSLGSFCWASWHHQRVFPVTTGLSQIDLDPLLGATEVRGDVMVAAHYHTCWKSLNMHVTVAVVQTTTQSSIFSSLLVLFPSFFLSCAWRCWISNFLTF